MTDQPPPRSRSYLYVPGDRADRLAKVFTRGADAIIVDLEDSVTPVDKPAARTTVARWLTELPAPPAVPVWIRINAGAEREADLQAIAHLAGPTGLVPAKTENFQELADLDHRLSTIGSALQVAPLLESAKGIASARTIATGPRVAVLHLGEVDLAADLHITPGPDDLEFLHARSEIVLASRVAGLAPPVGPVAIDLANLTRFQITSSALGRLGFSGRACIHPSQIAIVNQTFGPTADEIAWAKDVLKRASDADSGVTLDRGGNMIDEAVLRTARRITSDVD